MSTALTAPESTKLAECEAVIARGIETFVEVGSALMIIRSEKLYRQTHSTFTAYCQERFGMTARRAFQMIDAARVVENVNDRSLSAPTSEWVTRPLAKIKEPEQQAEVWQEAVETAPNGKVTASHVEKVVRDRRGEVGPEPNEAEATNPFPVSVDLRTEVRNAKAEVERSPWGRVSKWVVELPYPLRITNDDLAAGVRDRGFDHEYIRQVRELHAFLGRILTLAEPEELNAANR